MNSTSTPNEPTLYPSAYMVLTNKGYTNVTEVESRASSLALPRCSNVTERKHYYAGTDLCASREQNQACLSYAETKQSVQSNRVAARLGGGGLNAQYQVIDNDDGLQTNADILFKQSLEQVNHRVLHENNLECIKNNEFTKEELSHWIDGIPNQMKADVECDHSRFNEIVNSMLDDINHGQEKEVYFYHSDHLGSASWITDFSGMAVQHIQYLPYGEPYINQHPFGYSERFTFTGKERDGETGFGYFGARYMDHELMTMWLSVDPMADKYPSISPYAYCTWNPVKLVDPDGRDWYDVDESGHITKNEELSKKYKDNDVLYSTSTGERSKLFDKGTITSISNNNLNGKSGQIVCFGEGSTRDDHLSIFEFCANNTDVEFSLIQFEGGPSNTFMTTSHDLMSDDGKSSDDYGSEVTKAKDNPKSLVSHIHNHWANGMFGYGAQGDDFTFKEKVIELRGDMGEKPIFGIYKCGGDRKTRGYLNYDGEKIDPKTMKKL